MKRIALFLLLLLAAYFPASRPAHAVCNATLPFVLQNGTLADATQVMANFNAIITGLNNTCAASGINNDITALNGVAVLKPVNNLADLVNKQTSMNNLGVGCAGGVAPGINSGKQGEVIAVFATCFGVVADGVTNDTTAWNAVVTYLNSLTNATVVAPYGTSVITGLNPITTGGRIVCITGMGSCVFKYSSSNAFDFNGGRAGGLSGFKLINAGASCANAIRVRGTAFQTQFSDLVLDTTIGQLAVMGTSTGGDQAGTSLWQHLTSPQGTNTAAGVCSIFNLVNGFGFTVTNSQVFSNAFTTAGSNFLDANIAGPVVFSPASGFWDTINVINSIIGPFYDTFLMTFSANGEAIDGTVQNNYIINCQDSCFNVSGTGSFNAWNISNNWIDGSGVAPICVLLGANNTTGLRFNNNTIFGCGGSALEVGNGNQVTQIQVRNNNINGINISAVGTTYGILINGNATGGLEMNSIHVTGNMVSSLNEPGESGIATFGFSLQTSAVGGNITDLIVANNSMVGSIVANNYNFPAATTTLKGRVIDNVGLDTTIGALAIGASPFTHTAGIRPEEVSFWGSTATITTFAVTPTTGAGAAQVCQANSSGVWGTQSQCTVSLNPNEAVTVTYTVLGNLAGSVNIK